MMHYFANFLEGLAKTGVEMTVEEFFSALEKGISQRRRYLEGTQGFYIRIYDPEMKKRYG